MSPEENRATTAGNVYREKNCQVRSCGASRCAFTQRDKEIIKQTDRQTRAHHITPLPYPSIYGIRTHISWSTSLAYIFCACCPGPWLGPSLAALQYVMYYFRFRGRRHVFAYDGVSLKRRARGPRDSFPRSILADTPDSRDFLATIFVGMSRGWYEENWSRGIPASADWSTGGLLRCRACCPFVSVCVSVSFFKVHSTTRTTCYGHPRQDVMTRGCYEENCFRGI